MQRVRDLQYLKNSAENFIKTQCLQDTDFHNSLQVREFVMLDCPLSSSISEQLIYTYEKQNTQLLR